MVVLKMNEEIDQVLRLAAKSVYEEDIEKARELLVDLSQKFPEDLRVTTELGIIYAKLQKDHKAELLLREVIKKDPKFERAVSSLGHILDNSLRTVEAEELYRFFLEGYDASHCITEDLCRLLESEGRIEESLSIATAHASAYPEDIDAYNPIRFLLLQIEDRLEVEVEESNYSAKSRLKLLENHLHQFEIFQKIESNVNSLSELDIECLEDDIIRSFGEVKQLQSILNGQNAIIPDNLMQRINIAVKSIESRYSINSD